MSARNPSTSPLLFLLLLTRTLSSHARSPTTAASCSSHFFNNNRYTNCIPLPYLNCYLHWTYNTTTATAAIAFRATAISPSSSWVAWAINPTSTGMKGAQALVAYYNPSNGGALTAHTSYITGYDTTLAETKLSFEVTGLSAESSADEIVIFATVALHGNLTAVNHVWQVGTVSGGVVKGHPVYGRTVDNLKSSGKLDFKSGLATDDGISSASTATSRQRYKYNHGVLNAVSWGILMPIGALIAHYILVFPSADPAWFYLHMTCQCSAYIIGVAGFATGLQLGSQSAGVVHHIHSNIGITLFVFSTLQVFAMFLRPMTDHKYSVWL